MLSFAFIDIEMGRSRTCTPVVGACDSPRVHEQTPYYMRGRVVARGKTVSVCASHAVSCKQIV